MKKMTFGRILGLIAVLCVCWVTFMITRAYLRENLVYEYTEDTFSSECRAVYYSDGNRVIQNTRTGKITIKNIDWLLAANAYTDSLVIYSKNRKRGYFNRFTGEADIPEQYTHAWIFSEDLAAVVKNDKIGFINRQGNIVIDFKYPYLKGNDKRMDFVFHNGYCNMFDRIGKCGIINTNGEWVIEPQYDYINNPLYKKRIFIQNGNYGILDESLNVLIPAKYKSITLMPDYAIVTDQDETKMRVAYTGEILNPMLFDDVYRLDYPTGVFFGDGREINSPTGLYCYCVGKRQGLMNESGGLITQPLYSYIMVVNKNLFWCAFLDDERPGVLINEKGEIVK